MRESSAFHIRTIIFLTSIIVLTLGISNCSKTNDQGDPNYIKEVEEWHNNRITSLTKPDGWLSLTGLHWLKEGKNSFGGSEQNDIRFAGKNLPDKMGDFIVEDSVIYVEVEPGVQITHEDVPIKKMKLKDDTTGEPTQLRYQSLLWYIIKRGERYAIRLKDSQSESLLNFSGIETFPVQSKWRVTAHFTAYDPPKTIEVPNVLGTIIENPSPGKLSFTLDNREYSLDPIADPEDKRWFIIFGDNTNGEETYGAGRYLYIDAPGEDGTTIIDFNKAYNPPCVFTPYATCSLPPDQNFLELRLTAGEKYYHGYDH